MTKFSGCMALSLQYILYVPASCVLFLGPLQEVLGRNFCRKKHARFSNFQRRETSFNNLKHMPELKKTKAKIGSNALGVCPKYMLTGFRKLLTRKTEKSKHDCNISFCLIKSFRVSGRWHII